MKNDPIWLVVLTAVVLLVGGLVGSLWQQYQTREAYCQHEGGEMEGHFCIRDGNMLTYPEWIRE